MSSGIDQFSLAGKSVIVTGGSKGLGQSMAVGLASAGADVLITSRQADEVQRVADRIAVEYGQRVVGMVADVTSTEQVKAMVERTLSEFGKIDVLINNAGVAGGGPLEEVSYEAFLEMQDINVHGTWRGCRAVIPIMKQAGSGRIINIASTLGVVGKERTTSYSMSKGAVVQLTRALALELSPSGILCNAICPGPFLTPMNAPSADLDSTKESISRNVPLARWGRPEEIQGAAIFLASEASSFMTGSLVTVDGGWTAR